VVYGSCKYKEQERLRFSLWQILCLGYGLSFSPVPAMAAIGPQVAVGLGDAAKYIWFVAAWVNVITVGFMVL
jgi:hypothetical protein